MSRPYVATPQRTRFYRPPTLQSDFDNFLDGDLPHMVLDFELIHDWYDRQLEGYEPIFIRGEMYPESTKSRYENTDNNMNFRASVDSGIRKGDIVIASDDHDVYLLDWEVSLQHNNAPSRLLRCNNLFTFIRFVTGTEDVLDPATGKVIEQGSGSGWITVVDHMPCNAYRYDGRPEFSIVTGEPGIAPKALTYVTTQYNDQTMNIRIGDQFYWDNEKYFVLDINRFGLHYIDSRYGEEQKRYGTLKLQVQKDPGGNDGGV